MTESDDDEFYRRAILAAIEERKTSAFALSKEAGISGSGLRDIISGKISSTTVDKLRRIARALDLPITRFFPETADIPAEGAEVEDPIPTKRLPVRGTVQAGVWVEEEASDFDAPHETIPIVYTDEYPSFAQFALKVSGESMNEIIDDGDYAICVDVAAVRNWQDEDVVVVVRSRAGGQLRETTLKQVAITESGIMELWPRSTDPRFQEPIRLLEGAEDEMQVELKGLMIGRYSTRIKRRSKRE